VGHVACAHPSAGAREKCRAGAPQDGGGGELLVDALGDADVGEQHELLDQAIGLEKLLLLDVDRPRRLGRVKVDLDLGRGEVKSAGGHALRSELYGNAVEQSNALRQLVLQLPVRNTSVVSQCVSGSTRAHKLSLRFCASS
jgi:hypothetical protein